MNLRALSRLCARSLQLAGSPHGVLTAILPTAPGCGAAWCHDIPKALQLLLHVFPKDPCLTSNLLFSAGPSTIPGAGL